MCLDPSNRVESSSSWFDQLTFVHNPLPETSLDRVTLSASFLDKPVQAPFFISSMTGGSQAGFRINHDLARAAQTLGIPLGLGSMRVLFHHPEAKPQFDLRAEAPDVPIFGNFSAVQLKEHAPEDVAALCAELGLDGIAVHLNPGQELCQDEGDRDFTGLMGPIESIAKRTAVIVKETGFGIPPWTARRLLNAGARYVDVAGAGGTNWSRVEILRGSRQKKSVDFSAFPFADWGIPTALNLAALGGCHFSGSILASGGLRTPLDFAKAIALGAVSAGTALPVIRQVVSGGADAVVQYWQDIFTDVKRIMLLTGSTTVRDLSAAPLILSETMISAVRQLKHAGDWRRETG